MKPEDKIKDLINKSDAKTAAEADNRILAGAPPKRITESLPERVSIWKS